MSEEAIDGLDAFSLELGGASEIGMALALALMMFAVALGLSRAHFSFFKSSPLHFIGGVLAQIIGLPLLTLILVMAVKPAPSVALGMIIIACCPGGSVSNLLALFGRANTALSVSLTATSSIAAALITPLSILFWSRLYAPTRSLLTTIAFDAVSFLLQTLLILGVPVVLGMMIAHFAPRAAARLQKPLAMLGGILLLLIIVGAIFKYHALFMALAASLVPLVILHNSAAFALGYGTGLITRADKAMRRALCFEVGIQNSGLGIIILLTQLSGLGGAAAIAGLWGIWHIIGGGALVLLFRLADRRALRKGMAHV